MHNKQSEKEKEEGKRVFVLGRGTPRKKTKRGQREGERKMEKEYSLQTARIRCHHLGKTVCVQIGLICVRIIHVCLKRRKILQKNKHGPIIQEVI
jgi:hypothetical protein